MKKLLRVIFGSLLVLMLFPIGAVFWESIMGEELFMPYVELLFDTPEFYVTFWNSVFVTVISIIGQSCVAMSAAWGISIYFGKYQIYVVTFYAVLMMLPFQVMMLPQYFILQKLQLYDTFGAIIVPFLFSPFAVFLLVQNFKTLPSEMLEAARLDGASEWMIFRKIGIPYGKAGMISVMMLCFIDVWGMVEQPNAFIENKQLMLLSEYLPHIEVNDGGFALAASVFTLIPCILLILLCSEYFEEGLRLK